MIVCDCPTLVSPHGDGGVVVDHRAECDEYWRDVIDARRGYAEYLETERGGRKNDDGKSPLALIPLHPLLEIGQVMRHGGRKYGANNWRKGIAYTRLLSAALRHIVAFADSEDIDPDTGYSHLAHATSNLLMLHDLHDHREMRECDDRENGPDVVC